VRFLVPAGPVIFFLYLAYVAGQAPGIAGLIYPLCVVLLSEASRLLIYRSHYWPVAAKGKQRLLLLIPGGLLLCAAILFVGKCLRNLLLHGELRLDQPVSATVSFNDQLLTVDVFTSALVYGACSFIFLLFVYEVTFYFAKLRYTEKQRDRLENEKLQLELQQLKGIVNPHFLFNNLNSLSSLISESPQQAELFLDELTKVFRYLLRNNQIELITLKEEMNFIQSYAHLLQTRYGKSMQLHINLHNQVGNYLLPPLTLQLLIENAVKHNKMSKETPLQVELFNDGNTALVLRNNLSTKDKTVESTGIGLQSINGRYRLLNHQGLKIEKTEQFFSVMIPLIAPGALDTFEVTQAAPDAIPK
jgi:hypothetical protein